MPKKEKPRDTSKKTKQKKIAQKKKSVKEEEIDDRAAERIIAEAEAPPKTADDSFKIEVDTKKPKKSIFHFLKPKKPSRDITIGEFEQKLDSVFIKEKELMIRENKIQEIEERIEKKLDEHYGKKKFFAKEFFQGFLVGILFSLILILIYIQVFMKG